MSSSSRTRSRLDAMIDHQIVERGITDPELLLSLRRVPRERFVPATLLVHAFDDAAVPIGRGQTVSQPYVVALMTQRLELAPNHRVLEIGTGSGYQAAVLSHLVREVFTVERMKVLLDEAFERLASLGIHNVHLHFGDGFAGLPEHEPFDRVIVTAAPEHLPSELLMRSLVEGGLAVLPVGTGDNQLLQIVRKRDGVLDVNTLGGVRFVPMLSGIHA
jgi:protein-L-isoaspartate(D-aspartate) O-methyltransferase